MILLNDLLEKIKTETKNMNINQIITYFYNNYYEAIDMLESVKNSFNFMKELKIKEIQFFYSKKYYFFIGSEHLNCHLVEDLNSYEKEIPPIVRVRPENESIFYGNDGNHRLNTLQNNNLQIPLIVFILDE